MSAKLFGVNVTRTAFVVVEAETAKEAEEAAEDELNKWIDSGGVTTLLHTANAYPITSVDKLPKEWRGGALPFRSTDRIDEDEYSCEEILAEERP
jgi:hypothetical protein